MIYLFMLYYHSELLGCVEIYEVIGGVYSSMAVAKQRAAELVPGIEWSRDSSETMVRAVDRRDFRLPPLVTQDNRQVVWGWIKAYPVDEGVEVEGAWESAAEMQTSA